MVAVQDDPNRTRGEVPLRAACERLQVLNCGARERDWWEEYVDLPTCRASCRPLNTPRRLPATFPAASAEALQAESRPGGSLMLMPSIGVFGLLTPSPAATRVDKCSAPVS